MLSALTVATLVAVANALALASTTSTTAASSPTRVLPSPSTILSGDGNGYNSFDTPFKIAMYNFSDFYLTSRVTVDSNGWIALSHDTPHAGGVFYLNAPLPDHDNTSASGFPNTAFAPYWDNLLLASNTNQGVFYQAQGEEPNRTISFEWLATYYEHPTEYAHFMAMFREEDPAAVEYRYFDVCDYGASATVGMQNLQGGMSNWAWTQYSFDEPVITPGLTLRFDAASNSFETIE